MLHPTIANFLRFTTEGSVDERDLLLLLSLTGPRNVSQLSELARAAGIRQSLARGHSTVTLRPILEKLIELDLVVETEWGYESAVFARELSLRDGVQRNVIERIAAAVRSTAFPHSRYSQHGNDAAWFDFLVAMHLGKLNDASVHLAGCAARYFERFVQSNPLIETLCQPFDPEWLGIYGVHKSAVLAWTLDYANQFAAATYGLMPWLHGHYEECVNAVPELRLLTAEADILRGDWTELEANLTLGDYSTSIAGLAVKASLSLLRGHDEDALTLFDRLSSQLREGSGKKRGMRPAPRLFAIFHGLAMLRRGGAEDQAEVQRLAAFCQRDKEYEFRHSAGMLKSLAEAAVTPSKAESLRPPAQVSGDCLYPLLRGLYAVWFPVPAPERASLTMQMAFEHQKLANAGYAWLAEQFLYIAHRLLTALDEAATQTSSRLDRIRTSLPALPKHARYGRPLTDLLTVQAGWQLALRALDRLTADRAEGAVSESSSERIAWRIDPMSGWVEPILQKRGPSGWSSGRKVALKQLLADGAHHAILSEQDRMVVAHIREELSPSWGGYVNREFILGPNAVLELVHHPLVFVAPDLERPTELVRGEVRMRAEAVDDRLMIKLEPANVSERPRLVQEGGRWVVYCLDQQQIAIAKAVGPALTIPASGKQQALDVLGKLARFVIIQSSETIAARQVAADPTPYLRLVPSGIGLNVTAGVRPIGQQGPTVPIGQGASTLVVNVEGAPLQAERDLQLERSRMAEIVRECPALQSNEVEPGHFELGDPEQCLELVSQLRHVGDRVRVEWPQGKTFELRATVGRRSLRGSLKHESGWFFASGNLTIDSESSLELEQLVELLAEGPSRFLKLESGQYLEIEQELREMIDALRVGEQRRGKPHRLAIPLSALASLDQLTSADSGFKLDSTAVEWRKRFEDAFACPLPIPRGLQAELRDYQAEGFRWLARLAELELGACLADDMGLGKTVQIIALLLRRGNDGSAFVVAPTSVCHNWRRELERFAPSLRVKEYQGARRADELVGLGKRDVVVASYTLLQQDAEALAAIEWSTVVLDEGQFIKNADTQRARAAFGLRAKMRIVATGTPIENHPSDLWSLFRFLNPHLLGSAQHFQKRFGRTTDGTNETATRQRRDLRRILKPFILRRTKAQVLEDLPPLTEIRHNVELGAAEVQLYESLRKRALAKLSGGSHNPQSRVQVLAELMRLRRLCCHPRLVAPEVNLPSAKLDAFLELVEELLSNQHRALVFSQFVDFLAFARKLLDERKIRYQYLDGSTSQKDRAAAVDAFQAGDGDLFLISLKAGGFGLNLTGADYVIHLDPWWNPAAEQQASDRAHRIGQERPVTVYRLVTTGTIEERIIELHHRKRELADSLLDGTESAAKITEEELIGLLAE